MAAAARLWIGALWPVLLPPGRVEQPRATRRAPRRRGGRSRALPRAASDRAVRSIEPSGPRSASPGPSMEHQVAAAIEATLRHIALVVTVRKSPLENSLVSSEKSLVVERPA